MDGVLVLTDQLKAEAHAATVSQLGGRVPSSFYRLHMGKSHAAVREAFLREAAVQANLEEYTQIYHAKYRELLQTSLQVAPGAVALLEKFLR